jgi:hypothetical protein
MPQTHFRSTKGSHNQINVTNRFGNSDFILADCICFVRKRDRFGVLREFRSLKNGKIPFPVDVNIAEQNWRHHSISGWRLTYSLCRNFPSILFRSKVIAMVKEFFLFWGQIWHIKFFFEISAPQKALPSENLRRLRHYGPDGYIRSGCRVPEE